MIELSISIQPDAKTELQFDRQNSVTNCPLLSRPVAMQFVVNKTNRITVEVFNRVKGHDNIFALGDVAAMTSEKYSHGHPMLASVAIQQGALLVKILSD